LRQIEALGEAQRQRRAVTQFGWKMARSNASRSPWVDGGSRGKKWGRRRGETRDGVG
jgi:hypothetical protein